MATESKIQWQPRLEMIIVLITILGSNIPLYVHMDNKLDNSIAAIHETVNAIQAEMKDFHGRLCAIEERSKGLPPQAK